MPACVTDFGLQAMNREAEKRGSDVRFRRADELRRVSFAHWWQFRDIPGDALIVEDAIAQGLVVRAGGILSLTAKGIALRAAADAS